MTVYVNPEQKTPLGKLSKDTRVLAAEYVREALNGLLLKHERHLKGGSE
jgi:hypothetical protein